MKPYAVHFQGQPDHMERMRRLWNAPLHQPPFSVKLMAWLNVPVIVGSLLVMLSVLWICQKAGWMEER